MARADNLYSQIVTGMKIILPLAALGLLSTLFLISRTVDPSRSAMVTDIDLGQRAQDLGATNPRFAGVTGQGDEILFAAANALPDRTSPEHLSATDIKAQLRLSAGTVIDITSDHADMQQRKMTALLQGHVHITTSTGYVIDTQQLHARLDEVYAKAPGQVIATGPLGDLTAGQMLLHNDAGAGTPELLFTGGVKLIYRPGETGE
ncbi:lipopolysaccharide export system protein LptC [Roseovarius azorensis]|uniref:Lipopolysaccharide export system protein LptC n=1 Tax=Roseovarius azorensis TaxID=1287727 RepID=A0A1H7K528_9RHOB|nr:LPS export ABC transporter periplasmic protein LptC [Roseovarius azorensis]SEK81963.1 lipopolysaccharide export system protein LptC [Roseovarius azorensis]